MKFSSLSLTAALLGGSLLFSSNAQATVTYSLVSDQSSYTAAANSAVTVDVYLLETLTSGSTSVITADNGLFGGGFLVTKSSGNATLTGSAANTTAFGGPVTTKAGSGTTFQGILEGVTNSAVSGVALNGNSEILLGTVTVNTGATGGATVYALTSYNGATSSGVNTTFTHNYNLDKNRTTAPAFTGIDSTTNTFTVITQPTGPTPTFAKLLTSAPTDSPATLGTGVVNLTSKNPFTPGVNPNQAAFTATTQGFTEIDNYHGGDLKVLLDLTSGSESASLTALGLVAAADGFSISQSDPLLSNALFAGKYNTVLDFGSSVGGPGTKYFEIALPTGDTFDNLAVIPEPASLSLIGLAALTLLNRRRK